MGKKEIVLTFIFLFCSSPHQGKIINPTPKENKNPVCVYMTQEV